MTQAKWPDDALEAQMIQDAGGVDTDVGCHVRSLLTRIRELEAVVEKTAAGCRMALDAVEFREGKRKRAWDLAFMAAELRMALAAAKGVELAPEEAGYSEGQSRAVRLYAAAPDLLSICEALVEQGADATEDDLNSIGWTLLLRVRAAVSKAKESPR